MPLVEAFNRAKTPEEKQAIINQLIKAVQAERLRLELKNTKRKNIEAQDESRGKDPK